MSGSITVFVNASVVTLPAGADVVQAVRAFDAALERQLVSGAAHVTDGRGIEVPPTLPLATGAILRVVVKAHRGEGRDADP